MQRAARESSWAALCVYIIFLVLFDFLDSFDFIDFLGFFDSFALRSRLKIEFADEEVPGRGGPICVLTEQNCGRWCGRLRRVPVGWVIPCMRGLVSCVSFPKSPMWAIARPGLLILSFKIPAIEPIISQYASKL